MSKNIVIRFCGDSGDGMQLTGNMFSSLSAVLGCEISTLPDFPAEIRAPQGTLGGVSGFQVKVGKGVTTPGDKADVIIAMNSAALKVCVQRRLFTDHAIIVVDTDSFTPADLEKARYETDNPFTELHISESVQVVPVPVTSLTKESLKDSGLDNKSILKSRNMFAFGVVCWLFDLPIDKAIHYLEGRFQKKPAVLPANVQVLTDGYNYGNNLALSVHKLHAEHATDLPHGRYTCIAGNKATAWGLIAAAERAGKHLFLGGYPITPATDIMQELAARKDMGVMVVQAEDEIAGICTSIGASFAGDLACTCTSGPGLSLKSEGLGLAVMAELPLVVIDVQRGGPSTGLPTKTEQADLLQALYGRNGECPVVVLAASTPANCFQYAYETAKIALEHRTPVILLTDTYLANGSSLWRIPKSADLPAITPIDMPHPGIEGREYRNMGLEHDAQLGTISTDPANHQLMVQRRAEKVANVVHDIPDLVVKGNPASDLLLVGWGSTEGHLREAAEALDCATVQFHYLNPLPANTAQVLRHYKRVVVCELNSGQFAQVLRAAVPEVACLIEQYNEVTGQPLQVGKLIESIQ